MTACLSYLQLQLDYKDILQSRTLKMGVTVMTVEFGTVQHYSSLEENSEACFCYAC